MSGRDGICCNMMAMTREERGRYEVLRAKLEAAVTSVEELADGYSLGLREGGLAPGELAEWISFEKRCCPFFTLSAGEQGGSQRLQLTGPDGVKDFIRAEFGAIRFE
ncbi:MAG: hypothetical protein JO260_04225 [Acidobacteria bacterium]|nr:hypothetical protein [Acidobacteriota bacterium]